MYIEQDSEPDLLLYMTKETIRLLDMISILCTSWVKVFTDVLYRQRIDDGKQADRQPDVISGATHVHVRTTVGVCKHSLVQRYLIVIVDQT